MLNVALPLFRPLLAVVVGWVLSGVAPTVEEF
jgi:hypothetical protein